MRVPASEIDARIAAFQDALRTTGIDTALIVQASDLVYLAGVACDAHLVVPADGEPRLLVRRDLGRAREDSPLAHVEALPSLRELPALVGRPARLGLELDVLPAASYLRYGALFPDAALVDCSAPLLALRARKSAWEIDRAAAAGELLAGAQRRARELVRTGISDRELQVELETFLRASGHEGPMRMRGMNGVVWFGAVLAGPAGAVPPYGDTPLGGPGPGPAYPHGPAGTPLRDGDAVTVDLVAVVDGYLADQTRTLSAGPLRPPLAQALSCCERMLRAIERRLVPGTPWAELYDLGLSIATDEGFEQHYMGHGPSRVRFVGHGVGLELNEPPFLAAGRREDVLAPGHVVAVEPKLVFPGIGAVGIENTYAIAAAGGPRNLTPDG